MTNCPAGVGQAVATTHGGSLSTSAPWLALASDWFDSEMLEGATDGERLAWILLLCHAKAHGRAGRVRVRKNAFMHAYRLSERAVSGMLIRAQKCDAIEIDGEFVTICNWRVYQDPAQRQKVSKTPDFYKSEKSVSRQVIGDGDGSSSSSKSNSVQEGGVGETSDATRNGKQEKPPPESPAKISWSEDGWAGITDRDRDGWRKAYPACDIERQLLAMHEWLLSNPTQVKKNNRRFITNWLGRQQEKGGDARSTTLFGSGRGDGGKNPTRIRTGKYEEFRGLGKPGYTGPQTKSSESRSQPRQDSASDHGESSADDARD